jgi:succinate dehydrogenase / fumarate reductase flavoprotein subunit
MQGLADGYFVIPYTLGHYFASTSLGKVDTDHPAFEETEKQASDRIDKLLGVKGKKTVDEFHRDLGLLVWDKCGMARNEKGLKEALDRIPEIREEYWKNVNVTGSPGTFNQTLERAGRVADFLEFAELMVLDALERNESCGGHFREEHQTDEGEALRDDENYCHATAWEFAGVGEKPKGHIEPLHFEEVHLTQRSYK